MFVLRRNKNAFHGTHTRRHQSIVCDAAVNYQQPHILPDRQGSLIQRPVSLHPIPFIIRVSFLNIASINVEKSASGGNRRVIQFVGADGKRRSLRLGEVTLKQAEAVKLRVERLADAVAANLPPDLETAAWLQGVGPELHAKLSAVGLTPARRSAKVGDFLAGYVKSRRAGSKGTTVSNLNQARADLMRSCDPNLDLRKFTPAMADAVMAGHAARGLAPATSAMYAEKLKMMFADAVRLGLTDANPFDGVRMPSEKPDSGRKHYFPREVVFAVIDRCSPDWQLVAALSRFAGLRAPSEVLSLRWSDIDFPGGVMQVRSPKTEHHKGGESRRVPIFPDLRPFLDDALSSTGGNRAMHVVNGFGERLRQKAAASPNGWNSVSVGTPFGKLVKRAGFELWPKLMHNMRASCETDLAAEHPIHVVAVWLGHTPDVALGHYL